MYYLMIWDKEAAAKEGNACLSELEIPIPLAKVLFDLNHEKFPMLSSLSFDDYDLFSNEQLSILNKEFASFMQEQELYSKEITMIMEKISEAELISKSILFNPFKNVSG